MSVAWRFPTRNSIRCGPRRKNSACRLFIHPQGVPELNKQLAGNGWLANAVAYPVETTIALSHLIFEGTSIASRS